MKRLFFVLMVTLLIGFAATPASADNGKDDHVCFGGTTIVRANETPDDVLLFGCGARIEKGARVSRDVVAFGGDVVVEEGATIEHDIVAFGGDVSILGRVGNDVFTFGGNIELDSMAVVNHDVVTFGGRVERKEGATVQGQILRDASSFPRVRVSPPIPPMPPASPFSYYNWGTNLLMEFVRNIVIMLGLAALGVLIIVFMPNQLKQMSDVAQQSALPSLGVGCLTWLVVPPLMILFVLTCLGIPLSAVLGTLLIAAGVFGWVGIGMILGDRVLNALKVKNIMPILAMAVGLFLLWLITSIPLLGGLIWLFVASLAIGAVVLTRFGTRPYPMLATVPATTAPVVPALSAPPMTPATPSEPSPPSEPNPSA